MIPEVAAADGRTTSAVRLAIIAVEVALVATLLAVWFISDEVRAGRSLAVLFFYCLPSEFIIGLVPHEPVLLLYGAFYPAATVAIISAAGTVLAEGLNYSVLGFFNAGGWFEGMRRRPFVRRVMDLFHRAPFTAVVVTGFTPVPFVPIRLLVVLTGYPIVRYLLAVFVSRAPRFLLIAWLGYAVRFPDWVLLAMFAIMIIPLYLPFLRRRARLRTANADPGAYRVGTLPATVEGNR